MNKFDQLYTKLIEQNRTNEAFSDYVAAAKQAVNPAAIASKAIAGAGSLASQAVGAVGYGLGVGGKSIPGTALAQTGIQKTAGALGAGIAAITNVKKQAQEIEKKRMYRDRDPRAGEKIQVNLNAPAGGSLFPHGDYKITNTPKLGSEKFVDISLPNNFSLRAVLPDTGEYSQVFAFKDGKPLRDPQYLRMSGNLYYSQNDKKWKLESEQRLPAYMSVSANVVPKGNYKLNDALTFRDKSGKIIKGSYGGEVRDKTGQSFINILDPEYV